VFFSLILFFWWVVPLVQNIQSYYYLEIMSNSTLHVVLSYDAGLSTVTAKLVDKNGVPNSLLPVPFTVVGIYTFLQNDLPFGLPIIDTDAVTITIPSPVNTKYAVTVAYTANGVAQPPTSATIVIGVYHLQLTYDQNNSTLFAQIVDANGNPSLNITSATYTLFKNGQNIGTFIGTPSLTFNIPIPTSATTYRVYVAFTITADPSSYTTDASIIIDQSFALSSSQIIQNVNGDGTVTLTLLAPLGATNIQWAYNYELFTPSDPLSFTVSQNGIYEASYISGPNLFSFYSITEVVDASPAIYIRTVGNDGNLYGTFGTPQNVDTLTFVPVNGTSPFRYKIYVNGKLYSDASFINLSGLDPLTLIYVYVTDCCGIVISANTYILPSSPIIIPRPITGRPAALPAPPTPSSEIVIQCCKN
jgi:hypothetical protein